MAEISRFLGIVIAMYYREHGPSHFHARYGDHQITVETESGDVQGRFPRRALNHVLEWRRLHQAELAENWRRVLARQPLLEIEPLE